MAGQISAVLLLEKDLMSSLVLRHELQALGVAIYPAGSCQEAAQLTATANPPELILTDLRLSDGTWEDVVRLAANAAVPVNVVVVSRLVDVRLYVDTLEKGAFDFITPPFEALELSHVLRSAAANVAARRDARLRATLRPELELHPPLFAVAS